MATSKYRRLSSCGTALMPGAGSAISRSVSLMMRLGRVDMDQEDMDEKHRFACGVWMG